MKIRVKIGDLVEQITQAAITVDSKAPEMPLGKVYLLAKINPSAVENGVPEPALYLFSTDQASKTFIKIVVEEVSVPGEALVDPARLLGSLMGRDQTAIADLEVVTTATDEQRIRIKVGKNVANLPYSGAFEKAQETIKSLPKGGGLAKIKAQTLIEFIRRSGFCMPREENGQQLYAMGTLNLFGGKGTYTAQAMDGRIVTRHVAKQTETTTFDLPSILIPFKALDPLSKLLQRHKEEDIILKEGQRNAKGELQEIFFEMEKVLFGTVLRVGRYPDIQLLLNSHIATYEEKISREELKGSLVRAANFVENVTDRRGVKLSTQDEKLITISAENPLSDLKDELPMEVATGTFKSVTVLVNIDYLANIVAVQSGDVVNLGFNVDKTRALVVKDSTDIMDTCYAVMPMKLDPVKKPTKGKKEEPNG